MAQEPSTVTDLQNVASRILPSEVKMFVLLFGCRFPKRMAGLAEKAKAKSHGAMAHGASLTSR